MALYTCVGRPTGTLARAALGQLTVIGFNLPARTRDHLWTKPVAMVLGTPALLAGAWQPAGPLDYQLYGLTSGGTFACGAVLL